MLPVYRVKYLRAKNYRAQELPEGVCHAKHKLPCRIQPVKMIGLWHL